MTLAMSPGGHVFSMDQIHLAFVEGNLGYIKQSMATRLGGVGLLCEQFSLGTYTQSLNSL